MSKEHIKHLMDERNELDKAIAENEEILRQNGVDMKTEMVDNEGFPIAGADIFTIRTARNKIICLTNDRKDLTDQIEKELHEFHKNARCDSNESSVSTSDEVPIVHRTSNRPFAKIKVVSPGSPADDAGLKEGDMIIQFGVLHADNFDDIKQFRQVVEDSFEKKIRVTITRDLRPLKLELVPRKWAGAGYLGCSVLADIPAHMI